MAKAVKLSDIAAKIGVSTVTVSKKKRQEKVTISVLSLPSDI